MAGGGEEADAVVYGRLRFNVPAFEVLFLDTSAARFLKNLAFSWNCAVLSLFLETSVAFARFLKYAAFSRNCAVSSWNVGRDGALTVCGAITVSEFSVTCHKVDIPM